MKQILKFSIIIIALFISCRNNKKAGVQHIRPVPVKVAEVYEENVRFPVRSSGRLSVKSEQKLGFRTAGIIKHIFVHNGQSVKEGQILAELNLAEIQAQVNIASEAYQKANRDFVRAKNLYNDSVATLELFQNAKTALDIAESNLEVARFNLKYSKIEAPSNGKILKILMEENEMAAPGHPVLLFGSTSEKWVIRTNVSDIDIMLIHIGDSAKIMLDPYPGIIFNGVVSEIAGMADTYTGTYETETTLLNTMNKKMANGLIARVEILTQKTEKLFAVPADAVFNSTERVGYVYILEDTTVRRIKIVIDHISNNVMYVKGEFHKGDFVVTDGINYIGENTRIEIDSTE